MISCIISVFNQAEFLSEAIESVLNQTVKVEDIIIVDDGSQDNSLEIAKKYHNEYPNIWTVSQVNKGLAAARNTGIMNSSPYSSWILPLDCDDELLPNSIEKILETIKNNPLADIVAPSFKCFGLFDQEIILMKDPKLEDFRKGNKIGYCAAIRKSALLEVGGYSSRMVEGYEDLHLWCDLLSRGKKLITIPEVLWMYRVKEKSMYRDITPEIHKKLLAQINKDIPQAQLNFEYGESR